MYRRINWVATSLVMMLALVLVTSGCQKAAPSPSVKPPASTAVPPSNVPVIPGPVTGTLTGTVTNNLTNAPLAGVTVTTDPVIQGVTIATKPDGTYSADLPVGPYTLSLKKDNFKPTTQNVSIVSGKTTKNVALAPTARVVVNLGAALKAAPGASVSIKASVDALDGSTIKSYEWIQVSGTKAAISDNTSDTVKISLGNAGAYKTQLIKSLEQLDRFQVQPINPHALESGEIVTVKVSPRWNDVSGKL